MVTDILKILSGYNDFRKDCHENIENPKDKFAGPLAQGVSDNQQRFPSTHQPITHQLINPSTHQLTLPFHSPIAL